MKINIDSRVNKTEYFIDLLTTCFNPRVGNRSFNLLCRYPKSDFSKKRHKNPFFYPLVEKNRVRHGMKDINFTRVVVTLTLLGHQTAHSQNKYF